LGVLPSRGSRRLRGSRKIKRRKKEIIKDFGKERL
jgi:hypothetical protein